MPADAMIRMAGGLLLVILAILACAWLAKRAGIAPGARGRVLHEIDSLRLGSRNRVSVIAIDGTWLVVGISTTGTTLLHSQPAGVYNASDSLLQKPLAQGFPAWLGRAQAHRTDTRQP